MASEFKDRVTKLLKVSKKLASLVAVLSLVFAFVQFNAAPASASPANIIEIHPWCWYALNTTPSDGPVQVINVQPGDIVRFVSYESRNNPCTTSNWDTGTDLDNLFSSAPPPGEQPVGAPLDFTISDNAAPGMYSGNLAVYRYDDGEQWGNTYRFLVTPTRIPVFNTFDCNHTDVLPKNIYVNLDQDTWYANTVTGGCDMSTASGAFLAGAPYYVNGSAVMPYYFKGSLGAGYTYSYFRGHDEQAVYGIFAPTVTPADPTNIAATSFRANGSVTDHGVRLRWGNSTQSSISFCVSTSSTVDANGALNCDVSNVAGSPSFTDGNQGYLPDGTATDITTASVADITGLTTGTTYYYQIVGTNLAGVSAYGAVTQAVPVAQRTAATINWAPSDYVYLPMNSRYDPTIDAATDDNANFEYSVVAGSGTTSDCSIADSTMSQITVTTPGTCTVRATSTRTALHFSGTKDVTFTFIKHFGYLAWSPVTTARLNDSGTFTPSGSYVTPESAQVTFSVVSGNNSSNCTLADPATGKVNVTTPGTCVIRATSAETAHFGSATTDQVFNFEIDPNTIDIYPATNDGDNSPIEILDQGSSVFSNTRDDSFSVSWDKAAGKLKARSVSVYTGYIQADISFVSNGVTYSCSQVFGDLKAYRVDKLNRRNGATVDAQKAAVLADKTVNGKAFCTDITKLNPASLNPVGGLTKANFLKIKSQNKSAAELKAEKKALKALQGYTGQVNIVITRYRAWASTKLNYLGFDGLGDKLPATVRYTSINLN